MRTVSCPGCREPLTINPSAGPVIECEHCGKKIRLTPAKPAPEMSSISSKPAASSKPAPTKSSENAKPKTSAAFSANPPAKSANSIRVVEDDEEDEDDDAPRRKKKKKKKSTSPWYWVGIGVAGLFVIVAVGALVMKLTSRSSLGPADAAQIAKLPDRPPAKEPLTLDPALKELAEKNEADEAAAEKGQGKKKGPQAGPQAVKPRYSSADFQPLPNNPITIVGENIGFDVPDFDPAAHEKKMAAWREFTRRTLLDDYEKVGRRDPKWDDDVRAALKGAVEMFSEFYNSKSNYHTMRGSLQRAVDAGCDDPLVKYLYARSLRAKGADNATVAPVYIEAGRAFEKSKYSAYRRAVGMRLAAENLPLENSSPENIQKAFEMFQRALLVAAKVRQDGLSDEVKIRDFWREQVGAAVSAYWSSGKDIPTVLKWVDGISRQIPELRPALLESKSQLWRMYGWQARGSGTADTVTEEGWRLFGERLLESKKCLEQAYKLDPMDGNVCASMIVVCKALGKGDHEETRLWFDRAMKANPGNYDACSNLLDYLEPKWHGSREVLVGFGRSCLRSNNWPSKIPLLIAEAHLRAIGSAPLSEWARYTHTDQVRDDINSAYEEYLKREPEDDIERAKYAAFCYQTGQLRKCSEQFQRVGDGLFGNNLFTLEALERMRERSYRAFPPKSK